jgi:hypothetical protein
VSRHTILFISPRMVKYHLRKVFTSSTSAPASSSTALIPVLRRVGVPVERGRGLPTARRRLQSIID